MCPCFCVLLVVHPLVYHKAGRPITPELYTYFKASVRDYRVPFYPLQDKPLKLRSQKRWVGRESQHERSLGGTDVFLRE